MAEQIEQYIIKHSCGHEDVWRVPHPAREGKLCYPCLCFDGEKQRYEATLVDQAEYVEEVRALQEEQGETDDS